MTRLVANKALTIFALWTFYGVMVSVQTHYKYALANHPIPWGQVFTAEMGFAYLWAAATPLVMWLGRRFPVRGSTWWKSAGLHVAAALVVSSAVKVVWDFTALPLVMPEKVPGTLGELGATLVTTLDYGVFNYAIVLIALTAIDYYDATKPGGGENRTSRLNWRRRICKHYACSCTLTFSSTPCTRSPSWSTNPRRQPSA